jgi:hypothetical protein
MHLEASISIPSDQILIKIPVIPIINRKIKMRSLLLFSSLSPSFEEAIASPLIAKGVKKGGASGFCEESEMLV